jgi:hypothetical protein
MTKVQSCSCKHNDQDRMYGKGKRLHNQTRGNNRSEWRCTVCGEKHARYARGGGFYPVR